MKICFMGSMEFAVPILEGLNEHHDVQLVVTQPDKPVGRKQVITPTPVKEKAMELGIEVFQPINIKRDYDTITSLDLDFIIVAAYGQMIPEIVLNHASRRAINVHASLLPKYRGGSPMHRAIQHGDRFTGVTIMYMAQKMDAGDILTQQSIPISDRDNVGSLESKLSIIGRDLLLETINKLPNITPTPQDEKLVTFAYNIKPEEEQIDFNQSAMEIYHHVRAFNPWPVTHFKIDGQKVKLFSAEYESRNCSNMPGQIVEMDKHGCSIQTKDGLIKPLDLQLQGKKRMNIKDFMNGVGRTLFQVGKIAE